MGKGGNVWVKDRPRVNWCKDNLGMFNWGLNWWLSNWFRDFRLGLGFNGEYSRSMTLDIKMTVR